MNQKPQILYQYPESAGGSFRPSNGTEGDIFEAAFCSKCAHDWKGRQSQTGGCQILGRALIFDVQDEEYPTKEWVFDKDGWPICTEFKPITPLTLLKQEQKK